MSDGTIDRRTVLKLLGCTAAGLAACADSETPLEGLVRVLELQPNEQHWLDVLDGAEIADLYRALTGPDPVETRTVALLMKVLGPRSTLFPYVGYPTLPDRPTVCDGLLRE